MIKVDEIKRSSIDNHFLEIKLRNAGTNIICINCIRIIDVLRCSIKKSKINPESDSYLLEPKRIKKYKIFYKDILIPIILVSGSSDGKKLFPYLLITYKNI